MELNRRPAEEPAHTVVAATGERADVVRRVNMLRSDLAREADELARRIPPTNDQAGASLAQFAVEFLEALEQELSAGAG